MLTVGIRELKNGLSRYIKRVRQGETIVITDRGPAYRSDHSGRHTRGDRAPHRRRSRELVRPEVRSAG